MTFEEAVLRSPEVVRRAMRPGKQAMKGMHRGKVVADDERRFLGSLDLDEAYRASRPNEHRWDYGFGFREDDGSHSMIWIEVHPASAGEVDHVLKKLGWLTRWLRTEAARLDVLSRRKRSQPFHWLATDAGVNIQRGSPQARRIQAAGLSLPRRQITLR